MSRLPLLLLFLAVPLLLAIDAQAQQGSISGRVLDASTNDPIPSASVAVLDGAEEVLLTGGITDMQGRFQIRGLEEGAYAVEVSFVGYRAERVEAIEVESGEVNIGTITLVPDVAALDGVEVSARRQAVEVQIDRTVYNTADDPLAAGGVASDVLENIPSIDVDFDGNVSLRGSDNVTVFINGRPAPVSADLIADYLRQLPAEIIDRVEVIPNPSARYEPDGMAGIINIVLREDTDAGLGGSLTAGADTRGSVNATGLASYGRGPWSLSSSYSFRHGQRTAERTSFRINRFANPLTTLDQIGLDDRVRTMHRLGLSADYTLARRTTLSASVQLRSRDQDEDRTLSSLALAADRSPLRSYERSVRDDESRLGGDFRFGFRHAFEEGNRHQLTSEARVDLQVRERNEHILEQPTDGGVLGFDEQATRLDRQDRRASLDLDYVRPLLGARFEAGYGGYVRLQERDFFSESRSQPGVGFEMDPGLTNESDYALWVHALYGQVAHEFGPLGLQAGVRLESATTDFTLVNEGETFRNAYLSAFPSAFLSYEIGENQRLRGAYSRRVNRPRTDHLNPFPRFDDPLNIYVGNPNIRPEYIDAFELGYIHFLPWGSLTLSPYARRTTDVIRRLITLREDGVTVRTVDNIATSASYGAEGIVSFEGWDDDLRGHVSLEGFRRITEGTAVGTELQQDAFGWGGRVNTSYALDRFGLAGAVVQGSVRYRAPMRTEQGRTGTRLFTDLAFRQRLLDDRLNLNLRVRDPLGTANFNYVLDQPSLYQEVYRDWGAQRVAVSLSYRFNQPDRGRGQRGGGGGGDEGFGDDGP